eukprot:scaffold612632_cov38-Prasinocladus_malaysianus.AAC.1
MVVTKYNSTVRPPMAPVLTPSDPSWSMPVTTEQNTRGEMKRVRALRYRSPGMPSHTAYNGSASVRLRAAPIPPPITADNRIHTTKCTRLRAPMKQLLPPPDDDPEPSDDRQSSSDLSAG